MAGRRASPCTVWLAWLLLGIACSSCMRGPTPVRPPDIHSASVSRAAIASYDTNGDEKLDVQELDAAPGLKAALASGDSDGDRSLTAEEIAARIENWKATGVGITSFGFLVTLDGKPLEGATVTFEPEPFLGDDFKAASAVTNATGRGGATIPPDARQDPSTPPGMYMGLYRVRISKADQGREVIPAQYNAQTTIGQEVAFDVPEIVGNRVVFALRSK